MKRIGLKIAWLTGYIAAAFVVLMIIGAIAGIVHSIQVTSKPTVAQSVAPPQPNVAELLTLVNKERAKTGVMPLALDSSLSESAQFKANDMVARNYYAHEDPTTGKLNGVDKVFELSGTKCRFASENIVENAISSADAVDAWTGSPAHLAAMVDSKNTLTGFGILNGFVVEHFCQTS